MIGKAWSDNVKMGQIILKNRIVMSALTRQRCNSITGIPNDLLVQYYSQRVGSGLILTQSTAWCQRGQSFPGAACLYNQEHVNGWKKVVNAVHKKDPETKIFLQLFHSGRVTHTKFTRGLQPWAPSAIAVREQISALKQKWPTPIQMSKQQIKQTQQDFQKSVILSKQCGFDGIQFHSSTGFLSDSFLRSGSNHRTDQYGGSVQNRCRFVLQCMNILLKHYKPYQIGIKLSPVSIARDMIDKNPIQTYTYLLKELSKKNIGFVQFRQSCEKYHGINNSGTTPFQQIQNICKTFRPFFNGLIIANDSFTPQSGIQKIKNEEADLISFGKLSIANPDLAQRILNNKKVNTKWDPKTFYGQHLGATGYTDYKIFQEQKEQK